MCQDIRREWRKSTMVYKRKMRAAMSLIRKMDKCPDNEEGYIITIEELIRNLGVKYNASMTFITHNHED